MGSKTIPRSPAFPPVLTSYKLLEIERKPQVGTIVGSFDGALDGIRAQLIRRTRLGYTVKLLESKDAFRHGDIVSLSLAEFQMNKGEMAALCPQVLEQ
jgi:hypothetical protein